MRSARIKLIIFSLIVIFLVVGFQIFLFARFFMTLNQTYEASLPGQEKSFSLTTEDFKKMISTFRSLNF